MNCIPIPARVKNLTGMTFGRLEVLAYAGLNEYRQATWLCRCTGPECGGKQVTVRGNFLRRSRTKSCGCLGRAVTTHGLFGHPLYSVWCNMIYRCANPSLKEYPHYGGRGITVCDAWLGTETGLAQFVADMAPTYRAGLQLDRRDNDGPYSPENCRWVTRSQNGRNKRSNRVIEFAGQRRCVAEWAQLLGLSRTTLSNRLIRGWATERALTEGVATERLADLGLTE